MTTRRTTKTERNEPLVAGLRASQIQYRLGRSGRIQASEIRTQWTTLLT